MSTSRVLQNVVPLAAHDTHGCLYCEAIDSAAQERRHQCSEPSTYVLSRQLLFQRAQEKKTAICQLGVVFWTSKRWLWVFHISCAAGHQSQHCDMHQSEAPRMRAKVVEESFIILSVALYTGLIGKEADHGRFARSFFEPTPCSPTSACFHSLSNVWYTRHKLRKWLLSWRSSFPLSWLLAD